MKYCCDTNFVSELRKLGTRYADPGVQAWTEKQKASDLAISVITLMELEIGVRRMERRDVKQGLVLRNWFQATIDRFEDRILPIDKRVAELAASLHVPNPQPEKDALIAATALLHGLTVVTRNVTDFQATGVPLFNPWTI